MDCYPGLGNEPFPGSRAGFGAARELSGCFGSWFFKHLRLCPPGAPEAPKRRKYSQGFSGTGPSSPGGEALILAHATGLFHSSSSEALPEHTSTGRSVTSAPRASTRLRERCRYRYNADDSSLHPSPTKTSPACPKKPKPEVTGLGSLLPFPPADPEGAAGAAAQERAGTVAQPERPYLSAPGRKSPCWAHPSGCHQSNQLAQSPCTLQGVFLSTKQRPSP